MSMIQSDLLLGQEGGGGYTISRSLRFNSSDSAYLSRVFSSTGNRTTWTWATWIKRSNFSSLTFLFHSEVDGNNETVIYFDSSDQLGIYNYQGGSFNARKASSAVFRDPSAWYHVIVAWDTTNATAADRVRLYVNGSRVTAFATSIDPSQNTTSAGINVNRSHRIGSRDNTVNYLLNGYLADIHFIDGQALTPSSFGEFDTNNVWQPKAFSGGSYGTNGFHLDFADNSAATATTLGKDTSGNGNNWTPNNLSVTAGAGNDSLVDSPTNYGTDTGAGGEVRGNYCTWNPLAKTFVGTVTFSNGNLDIAESSGAYATIPGTIAISSGKYYWEVTRTASSAASDDCAVGITLASATGTSTIYGANNYVYRATGNKILSTNSSSYGASWTTGDIIGVAVDLTASTLTFYKNGVSQGAATTSLPTGVSFLPCCGDDTSATLMSWTGNFGQRPFAFPVSGFKALCTANLPTPTIANGATAMDVKLYTGNGSTQTISGLNFSPDLVWIKSRSNAQDHYVFDFIRDSGILRTNTTGAETTGTDYIDYNSDGFVSKNGLSSNGYTYAAWCWDAGTSTVTNTQGSITSQVRANASAGFSVVSFTGAGGSQTVGHGLGVTPAMIIAKNRATTNSWAVWFTGFTANEYLVLNSTGAKASFSPQWGSTPTSTVFGVADSSVNGSGNGIIAYCFAPVAGYSSFGSYTGNGSTDGPFVYTGFRPRWLLVKCSSSGTNAQWFIFDTARDPYNVVDEDVLAANSSDAEGLGSTWNSNTPNVTMDILSNGFKLRLTSTAGLNQSGQTYIYAAFAEHPFATSRAR